MGELHKNYIGGEWVEGEPVANLNPSNTREVVGRYARASLDDANAAIAAARDAFPAWSRSGIQQRHDILKTASDEIFRRREEIGQLLARRRKARHLLTRQAKQFAPPTCLISSQPNACDNSAKPYRACGRH